MNGPNLLTSPLAPVLHGQEDRAILGESPRWISERDSLLSLDVRGHWIEERRADEKTTRVALPAMASGVALCDTGELLLFGDAGRVWLLDLDDLTVKPALNGSTEIVDGHDFNDVAADPAGGMLCGTMPKGDVGGALYQFHHSGRVSRLLDGVFASNGITFSPDGATCYFSDSAEREIHTLVRGEDGWFEPHGTLLRFPATAGRPDGLATDSLGRIWCAMWDGASIAVISPTGDQVEWVPVPTDRPTSLCFSGQDLQGLLVTSARAEPDDGLGGSAFVAASAHPGLPAFRARNERFKNASHRWAWR